LQAEKKDAKPKQDAKPREDEERKRKKEKEEKRERVNDNFISIVKYNIYRIFI
jgi:hypothetical protein